MKVLDLIRYEFAKVYLNKRFLIMIVLLVLVNLGFFYWQQRVENSTLIQNLDAYRDLADQYEHMPTADAVQLITERKEWLDAYGQIESNSVFTAQQDDPAFQETMSEEMDALRDQYPDVWAAYTDGTYVPFSGDEHVDVVLTNRIYDELAYIGGYTDYLNSVEKQAGDMTKLSIFANESSFSYKNIQKTAADFHVLRDIPLRYSPSDGIAALFDYKLTDILVLALMLLLCMSIVSYERDNDYFDLLRVTHHGKGTLIAAKLVFFAVNCAAYVAIFYGSILLLSGGIYGLGDLSRSVQSIPLFKTCTIVMSVSGFLWRYILMEVWIMMTIGYGMLLLFVHSKNSATGCALSLVALTLEFLMYLLFAPSSFVNLLKFINVINYMYVPSLLAHYQNANFFTFPVNVARSFPIIVGLLSILLIGVNTARFFTDKQFAIRWLERWIDGVRRRLSRVILHGNLFLHELYKLMITNKGVAVLLALVFVQGYFISKNTLVLDQEQTIYADYMVDWQGNLSDATLAKVDAEQARYDALSHEMAQYKADYDAGRLTLEEYDTKRQAIGFQLSGQSAFMKVRAQIDQLLQIKEDTGIDVHLLNLMPYTALFGLEDTAASADTANMLIAMAVLILCIAGMYAFDNKNDTVGLVKCCSRGRQTLVYLKFAAAALFALIVVVLVYGAQIYNISRLYEGLPDFGAPIQSLPHLSGIGTHISIGQYTVFLLVLRYLGLVFAIGVTLCISLYAKTTGTAVISSILTVCAPVILYMLGINFLRHYPLIQVMAGNMMFIDQTGSPWFWMLLGVLAGSGILFYVTQRKYLQYDS